MRNFSDLDQNEVLAVAISLGEEHARIYAGGLIVFGVGVGVAIGSA